MKQNTARRVSATEAAAWFSSSWLDSDAGRALDETEPWIGPASLRKRKAQPTVAFPHPKEISDVQEARSWQSVAENLAAELSARGTAFQFRSSLILGAVVGAAIGILATGPGIQEVGAFVCALVFLGLIVLFFHDLQVAFSHAPTWERRALEYSRRAELLERQVGEKVLELRHEEFRAALTRLESGARGGRRLLRF